MSTAPVSMTRVEVVPLHIRPLLRLCFEILAHQQGENYAMPVMGDVLETYVAEQFRERIGMTPAEAEQFISEKERHGLKRKVAIRELLKKRGEM